MKKNWKIYCQKTFNNLKANQHEWETSPEWKRAISRDFYLGVFDSGNPNPTGFISEEAYVNKINKKKTVFDHCYSPQFIGRMIMDNRNIYLSDYHKFEQVFWYSCSTIIVVQKENENLSNLTINGDDGYKVLVPTHLKYKELGIKLFKRPEKKNKWIDAQPVETNILNVPQELLEYEKQYLVESV